ncbi:MAG TPA: J domain-containing protein, partial [Anaeromyxobacteraceae bacterium]|nr:J domain-containing protein [Anaeromyxobacteraceae bacterium]
RLTLDAGARYVVHLKRGTPEHASSNDPADDLGAFLVARGLVAAERLAGADVARTKLGGDLVTALAALGVLNPAESFRVLQEHAVGILSRALSLHVGTARWEPNVPSPPSAFPLGSRFALLCDAVRRLDALAVRQRLGARIHRVALRAGGRISIADLKLTALEARAGSFFDQVHSPAELAARHPAEATSLLRVALLLAETELLSFGAERPPPPEAEHAEAKRPPSPKPSMTPAAMPPTVPAGAGAPTTPPAPRATAAPTATPIPAARMAATPVQPAPIPAAPATTAQAAAAPATTAQATTAAQAPAASVESLRATLERMAAGDHFEVLGVGRDAPSSRIKTAYFQLAKQYHPDSAYAGENDEQRKLRADVFARVSEAWRVLSDEGRRASYIDELANGGAPSVDVAALLEAEQVFQQAVIQVKTRQYAAALGSIDRAAQLNPKEPEFDVWRAWVLFLVDDDKKGRRTTGERVIEAALKVNPRCMPGYLFLGQMAKLTGDVAQAERHLKRGLVLDGENAELLRELKHLRK